MTDETPAIALPTGIGGLFTKKRDMTADAPAKKGFPLNAQQQEIVDAPATGVTVVIAGAGCGKTNGCILPRAASLYKRKPGTIAVLAFGKDIKNELKDKVASDLDPGAAGSTVIFTNHGLGLKLAMSNLWRLGLPDKTELVTQEWVMIKFLKDQIYAQTTSGKHLPNYDPLFNKITEPQYKALFKVEETANAKKVPQDSVAADYKVLKEFTNKKLLTTGKTFVESFLLWAKITRFAHGKVMFRDLLPLAAELPQEAYDNLGITHILVDEAQDLSVEQHAVIEKLYRSAQSLTFVGDSAQCIFRFAGSRPDLFLGIPQRYPGAHVFYLETNYRCDQPILDLANVILRDQIGSPVKLIPPGPRPGKPIMRLENPDNLIPWLQGQLQDNVQPKDNAILLRANSHALKVEIALNHAGIAYNCRSGSFFQHRAVEDLLSYIWFLGAKAYGGRPDLEHWETIVGHVKFLGKQAIETSWKESGGSPLSLTKAPSGCRTKNQQNLWYNLVQECDAVQASVNSPGTPAVTTLKRIYDAYVQPVWEDRWADDPDKLEEAEQVRKALFEWAESFTSTIDMLKAMGSMKTNDPEGVVISTTHKAKGQEWRNVAIWNLGEGTFPLNHSKVDIEEEMCILYVAVTRAKKQLVLVRAAEQRVNTESILHKISEEQNQQFKQLMDVIDSF